jgi:hypothetical protein
MRKISTLQLMTVFAMALMGALVGGSVGATLGVTYQHEGVESSEFAQLVLMMSLKYSGIGAVAGSSLAVLGISLKPFFITHERAFPSSIELAGQDIESGESLRLFSERKKSWY